MEDYPEQTLILYFFSGNFSTVVISDTHQVIGR
jgi:hypothetical protein